jgi:hypothetical protein
MNKLWVLALVAVGIMPPSAQAPAKTKTFYSVTGEKRTLTDLQVPDEKVKEYLGALSFSGSAPSTMDIETGHGTGVKVRLALVREDGTLGLTKGDLGPGFFGVSRNGRIVARIQHVQMSGPTQTDMELNYGDVAYLWLEGQNYAPDRFTAALVKIDPATGRRHKVAAGRVWFCSHTNSQPSNTPAEWKSAKACKEPTPPGPRTSDFHLGQWFPCSQGCCVFTDD